MERLNILYLSYNFPYPPTGGSISRDYNLIKQLSKSHNIFWINRTITGEVLESQLNEMNKYCKETVVVPWNHEHSAFKFIRSLFSKKPYIILRFGSKEMETVVNKYFRRWPIDLILCDHIYLAQYLPKHVPKNIPVIANSEDNGFTYYKRMSESKNFIRALYGKLEWKKMLNYELEVLRKYRNSISTSETERKLLMSYFTEEDKKSINVGVVRNGVDIEYFKPQARKDFTPSGVFTAWYKYFPNTEGAVHFIKSIFPLIKKEIKDFKVYMVGKEPPAELKNLSNDNDIIVTGAVKDIRPYMANADAAIVPLKVGGGTRLKILEAMAAGVPVVSTVLGAEGLEVTTGENILIGKTDEEFASAVIKLVNNKSLSEMITRNGLEFVHKYYSWEVIGKQQNQFVESVYGASKGAKG